jgi:hypothetical protein
LREVARFRFRDPQVGITINRTKMMTERVTNSTGTSTSSPHREVW